MSDKKVCHKCNTIKNMDFFASDRSRPDGKSHFCKECDNKKVRAYYHRNKEIITKKRHDNPDDQRNKQYKCLYGITVSEYDELLHKQKGVCAVCGRPPGARRLCVDHSHTNGKVRGLLCKECNTSLGNVNDNIGILRKLIEYLTRNDNNEQKTNG